MKNRGILAFDIDGTLTHKLDWIDPKIVQELANLQKQNWQIALITGRIFSFAWRILKHLTFPYTLAVQNGADILLMPSKKIIKQNYLDSTVVQEVEKGYGGEQEDFIIYAGVEKGDFCYYRPERFSEKGLKYLQILANLDSAPWQESNFVFEERMSFPLIKCFGKEEEMRRLYQRLHPQKNLEISMIRDPIDRELYLNLITHPEANKGKVLEFLRSYFHPPLIIAAGDDRNDLKMLQEADIAIAIESAPPELKEVADILAKHPEDLGILAALEEAIQRARS